MRDVQRSLLMQFVPNRIDVDFDHAFEEFLFEEDEGERPVLRNFIGRRGPKSLVVPNFNHLFDERNPTVEMFAKKALKTFIPIISLADDKEPLTPALLAEAGDWLPHKIMGNQINVQNSIKDRFAKLKIKLGSEYA